MTTYYKRLFLAIVCCAAFIGCKPKLLLTQDQYREKGAPAPVPYTIYSYSQEPQQVLLVLPAALDSFKLEEAPFFTELLKNDFQIVLIEKPNEGEFYTLQSLDYASQRESEILKTSRYLAAQGLISLDSLSILGLDEGAYLAPLVATQLQAKKVIFINGGPFSPLMEIERLAQKNTLNQTDLTFIKDCFDIETKQELFVKTGRVKEGRTTAVVLGNRSNVYWLSYNQTVLSEVYTSYKGVGHWILFKDYPLNHPSNAQYLGLLNGVRNDKMGRIIQLEGTGFYTPKNVDKISEAVEAILLD